jgi:hypothetical protein
MGEYQGARKFWYADQIAEWQTWFQAHKEGQTELSWEEWAAEHPYRPNGEPRRILRKKELDPLTPFGRTKRQDLINQKLFPPGFEA